MYQASTSIIYFTKTLWPEFTFWQLLAGVFYYQRHYKTMANVQKSLNEYTNYIANESLANDLESAKGLEKSQCVANWSQRATDFLEKFEKRKHNQLLELSNIKLPDDSCKQTQEQTS